MTKFRLAAGVATIAFVAGLSSTAASAMTADTTAVDAQANAQSAAPVNAKKAAAAERRKAKRRQRAVAAEAAAARKEAAVAAKVQNTSSDGSDGDIVVTGTRIAGANYAKTGAPVQTVGRSELNRRGLAHLEEALNSLPAIQPDLGNSTRNTNNGIGSFGRSPVNLRNLGSARTLTLINGQRARNDTNSIPAAMIERIEVLTGGASAVYGSDAVGGVINYILKRNYTGITIDGEGSFFQTRNDNQEMMGLLTAERLPLPPKNFIGGPQGYINGSAGKTFLDGRANITLNAGYRKTGNLRADKLDNTACWLGNGPPNNSLPGAVNDHSQRFCWSPQTFNPYSVFNVADRAEDFPGGPGWGGWFSNAVNGTRVWRNATDTDQVRGVSDEFLYRNDSRFNWGGSARFVVEESSETEINATYARTNYSTESVSPNNGTIVVSRPISINCDNPFLGPQQAEMLCGTKAGDPNVFGKLGWVGYHPKDAKNIYSYRSNEDRITAEAKGKITNDIRFSANFVRTDTREHRFFSAWYSERRLANALRARRVDGKIVCLPPETPALSADPATYVRNLNDDKSCVPLDIFSAAGPDAAGYKYISENPSWQNGRAIETVVNGNVSGNLGSLGLRSPLARNPIGFSVGVEGRRFQTSSEATGASYEVPTTLLFRETDYQGELSVPLIQGMKYIDSLSLSGAYRYMRFPTTTGSTYRLGLDYRVNNELALRSSYSTSYRVDVYQTYSPNYRQLSDPWNMLLDLCSPPGGAKPVAKRLSQEQCAGLGVTAQQYAALTNRKDCNEEGKCPANLLWGGNRDLKPEMGQSVTVGLTYTPEFLPNASFSVDFYRNKINQFISSWNDPWIIFIQCQSGIGFYCSRYHRDPATGRLDVPGAYADGTAANFGWQINAGVDFNADYRFISQEVLDRDIGEIAINFNGNLRTLNKQQKLAGQLAFDCTGYYGYGGKENCGSAASSAWRHNVRVVWALPWSNLALNALWRYTAGVTYAGLQSNPILSTPPKPDDTIISPREAHIPASSFFDVGATIRVNRSASLRLTINNVFDTDPYLMVNNNGGWYNTQPLMYDVFGRKITLGFGLNF